LVIYNISAAKRAAYIKTSLIRPTRLAPHNPPNIIYVISARAKNYRAIRVETGKRLARMGTAANPWAANWIIHTH
jgi:hypothetical protein